MADYLASAEIDIEATPEQVWEVLTNPPAELWFGAEVSSDWRVGSPITWNGEWEGKPYEDKGEVLEIDPGRLLRFTHFSPLTGKDDVPENYHTLTWTLSGSTHLTLTQDNNASAEEAEHSTGMWTQLLGKVKSAAEVI
ncbi:SRPBCC domain-containing protein [Kribbella sp. NBC_01505]|uniref:SRPBCC domain-containing protein n=1 Tax=Kribbella sp. NBC_01505 TaxID=2903580 RepID=UPI0038667838